MMIPYTNTNVRTVLFAISAVLIPAAAYPADNTRYVSITGSNANACTLTAPCRTFQRGINMTPAGGELRILDSGFYGNNANVRKSLTISGNGNTVYLGNSADDSLVIDAPGAVVTLRGLVLDGQGAITVGVNIETAAAVYIDRCVIRAYSNIGVFPQGTGLLMRVRDSIFRNGSSGIFDGTLDLRLTVDNSQFSDHAASSGSVALFINEGTAVVRNSTFAGNSQGIVALGAFVTVASTTVVDSSTAGLSMQGGSMTIESSVVRSNAIGLQVAPGTARISTSSFTENGVGIGNSGTVETLGNNIIRGNTTNVSGNALTPTSGD
jgi:hypothetical protein